MPVEIQVEGLQTVNELLAMLREIGSTLNGAELRNVARLDSTPMIGPKEQGKEEAGNAQILGWLKEGGRDFVTPTEDLLNKISKAFAMTVETRLKSFFTSKAASNLGVSTIEEYKAISKIGMVDEAKVQKLANEVAGAALKEAIFVWMDDIVDRINKRRTVDGEYKALNKDYAKYKREVFGFDYPIGKASGQLLENLDTAGLGARNVRIKKDRAISTAK